MTKFFKGFRLPNFLKTKADRKSLVEPGALSAHLKIRDLEPPSDADGDFILRENANLSSPIYSLPNEVLEVILCYVRPSVPHSLPDWPMTLSHVTRRWRHLSLHTPNLWTDLRITFSIDDEYLSNYVNRSSNRLLDVLVDLSAETGQLDEVGRSLEIIMSQFFRTRTLMIDARQADSLDVILHHLYRTNAPMLEALHVRLSDQLADSPITLPVSSAGYWEGAPVLTSLALLGIGVGSCNPPLTILTHLHLGSTYPKRDYDELHSVLTSTKSLERLHLAIGGLRFPLADTSKKISLPTLVSLTIGLERSGPVYHGRLYQQMSMPNLERLTFENVTNAHPVILWDAFIAKDPSQMFPKLKSLHLVLGDMEPERFVWLCEALPTATRVTVWQQSLNTTLPLLEVFEGLPPLWPELQHISVLPLTFRNLDSLRDVVTSRITTDHPLRSVGYPKSLETDLCITNDVAGEVAMLAKWVRFQQDDYCPSSLTNSFATL